jgi:hypothetical protein
VSVKMRRIAAVVALVCGGLMACGGGGDGDSAGDAARSGGAGGKGSPGEAQEERTPVGDVDPSLCPPVSEVGQRAGESLGLVYAVRNEDGDVDCEYESEDSDLKVMTNCRDYASLDAAVQDIDIRRTSVPGTEAYDGMPVGDEGVVQNMELSDPGLQTLGYRTIVRQGIRICQALWATDSQRDPDQTAGLRGMLDYVMATIVPAA